MDKSRVLIPDETGVYHEIVSVGRTKKNKGSDIYFFFPGNFKTLIANGKTNYQNLLLKENLNLLETNSVNFHEVHLRYPPDGNVHLKLKNSQGKTIFSQYTQHERISELTAAKRIFTVLPTNISRYPAYDKNEKEFDWKIKYDLMSPFMGKPILLNFWIGLGKEEELPDKANAITLFEMFEMKETLGYVGVFCGQSKDLQLFLSISRPKELNDFPKSMRLYLHSASAPLLKRKEK